ncbi:trimeric intracellular cation channel family protein [Alteromonadaceae bacterium M269]|nr:trimeric intracellular cation channel family protein [Alteromonadaceae bacterium M269]
MELSYWLHWIDLLGVAVFAISGTLMAYQQRMDGFGVVILASVTAIGGGTLRDIILNLPVFWTQDPSFLYAILLAAVATIIWLRFRQQVPMQFLLVADAIGLAFFNVMGLQKAVANGAIPFIAVVMGTMSGVFGGLIRDVICREVPLVLKSELYAVTCIVGGTLYFISLAVLDDLKVSMAVAVISTLSLRLLAMKYHWNLTVFKPH